MAREIAACAPLPVRTYDIDFGGVVSNIVYIRWLEDLRLLALAQVYPIERMIADGFAPVVTSTHIDYRRSVRLFDSPLGEMHMAVTGPARMVFRCRITVGDTVCAESEQGACLIELATGRAARLPTWFRNAMG